LCENESFCVRTPFSDGIISLLVSSFPVPSLIGARNRLIASLAGHRTGCFWLTDNGILVLLAQHFLSSSPCSDPIVLSVLRRVAENNVEIPQGPLIVSCLLQDLFARRGCAADILRTVTCIVEVLPGSIQEHDVNRIVSTHLKVEAPAVLYAVLGLLAVVDAGVLRTRAPQILTGIAALFSAKAIVPEMILAALDVMLVMHQHPEIRQRMSQMEVVRFVDECVEKIPEGDDRRTKILDAVSPLRLRGNVDRVSSSTDSYGL
jgi:hypothetical protein